MPNVIRIERGFYKGLAVGNGFRGEGSRITTSLNRGVLFNIFEYLPLGFNLLYLIQHKIGNRYIGYRGPC